MRIGNALLRRAVVAGALIAGVGELAALQRWRVREWLLRLHR